MKGEESIELNYKIKFFKAILGKESDLFESTLKEYWCTECDGLIKEGKEYYYPFEDFEQNLAQFPDEYIICKNCKQKHEVK